MILDTFGRLEVLGHQEFLGHLSEEEVAGVPMIRVDIVKDGEQVETRFFGTASIYCITPLSEQAVLDATRAPARRISVASYNYMDGTLDEEEDTP